MYFQYNILFVSCKHFFIFSLLIVKFEFLFENTM